MRNFLVVKFRETNGTFLLKVTNDELFRKYVNSPIDNENIKSNKSFEKIN